MGDSTAKVRVAIVSPSLAAYRVPVFDRLSEIPEIDLHLVFADVRERARAWDTSLGALKFNYTLLPTIYVPIRVSRREQSVLCYSPGLWQFLDRRKFDLVIALGWTMPNTFVAWLEGKTCSRPTVLWDESIPHAPSGLKQLAQPVLARYFGSFAGYLAASHACAEYMVQMGAPAARVALMPQVTNNAFYAAASARYRTQREAVKQQVGIRTPKVILFVGQLTARKNVLVLMEAFRALAATREDVSLLLVGEGPLRGELTERTLAYGLQDRVFVEPFASQALLPKYYALADLFVLPSVYDTFGVVVAEAMACGLPIVTTRTTGASSSIVVDGENGRVVEHSDVGALQNAMQSIVADDDLRARMSVESERIIAGWDVERVAQNFSRLVARVLSGEHNVSAPRRDVLNEL